MPPDNRENREMVYCHSCEDEWYRDESGLVCPNPACGSDAVEIIEPDSDPRRRAPEPQPDQHPLHDHNPWGMFAPDPDEADISEATFRADPQSQRGQVPPVDPFQTLFGTLLGGGAQRPPSFPGGPIGGNTSGSPRTTAGGGWSTSGSYTLSMSSGPNGVRITSTTGFPPTRGPGGPSGPGDDLTGIVDQMIQFIRQQNNPRNGPTDQPPGMPSLNPILSMLMGGMPGRHGDVAYTQEGFDQILTMLRDQHGGSGGAPPASEDAIAALPKVKISKEHLDEQGRAECSICMDPVGVDEEVTMLPCDHWFHGECIKSWLKEHDTCPQCRRGITPRDGNQNQPRTTGQAPQYWQVNEGDLEGLIGRDAQQAGNMPSGTGQSSGSNRAQSSSTRNSSTRGSVASVASNIIRRLAGGGANNTSNNNSGGTDSTGNNSRS